MKASQVARTARKVARTAQQVGNAAKALGLAVPLAAPFLKVPSRNAPKLDFRTPPRTPKRSRRQRRTQRWGTATGVYVGKFSKGKRLRKKDNVMTQAQKKGYTVTLEQYGTLTDNHAAYIGHGTHNYKEMANVIIGAILRKLFAKAGIDVNSSNGTIGLENYVFNGVQDWYLRVYAKDPTTITTTSYTYDILSADSLETIIYNWNDMYNLTYNYLLKRVLGTTGLAKDEFDLVRIDLGIKLESEYENRVMASLDLLNEHLTLQITSKIKIQNRTKADGEGIDREDTDRVDNMPLYGNLITFKGGHPKLRKERMTQINQQHVFNAVNQSGLTLRRGSVCDIEEPPNPKEFMNAVKVSKVMLNPGQIREVTISHKYSGKFKNIMQKLQCRHLWDDNNDVMHGIPGKFQLFTFEEMIRSISVNDINLVYERQCQVAGFLTSKRSAVALPTKLKINLINTTQ